ncbi:hypothetical protein GCM10010124_20320 [Pilimelia terevasa]|uniref:DUF2079 domain-containing protein n=1 Tax=Pilimelia terevasa TaxID=53372 RepID=A0A8J3BNS9_9ACTN|nr:DUF2079 domain-containing protein [Pilimelia terevasa]GGK27668.1 hypothetical protein GCM10010124_20320 [Pilimelia terevasa]
MPRSHPIGWIVAGAVAPLYAAISLLRHAQLQSTGFDLGIFTQAVRGYAELRAPVAELKGPGYHLLGDHFHPVLAVLAPFYRLFPDPRTLLVAQALLLALSVVPVTRWAVDRLGAGPGAAVGAAYGLSFGLQQAVRFDFHEIAFAVPLIAASVTALARRRWRAAAWWALPLLLVKEDQALIVLGIGAYICWKGSRRLGAAVMAAAVLAGAVIVLLVIPAFNAAGGYDYLGSAAASGDPVTRLLAPVAKWKLVGLLLAVTGLLALRSPLTLLVVLPLAARFWADRWTYWERGFHYNAVLMPILFAAAVDGADRLRADRWCRALRDRLPPLRLPGRDLRVPGGTAVAALLVAVALLVGVGQPAAALLHARAWRVPPEVAAARAVLAQVPDGAVVAADNNLSPQLVARCRVFAFPQAQVDRGLRTPWVATRDAPGRWNGTPEEYRRLVAALPAEGYAQVAQGGGVRLFVARGTPGAPPAGADSSLGAR